VVDKSITPLRSAVTEPMRYGRLFLAGDSAHILPPTGAKGLNLAAADARTLGYGLVSWFKDGDESALDGYSAACLRRAWQRVNFSMRMTELLHVTPGQSPALQHRLRLSELEYLVASEAASTSLAEGYVGFELP
jgi:p-hydroxybenzoate 3-monooxygenase